MTTIVLTWLLIATGGSNSSPSTIAKFNDERSCRFAATQLHNQSADQRGAPYIYAYCIPVDSRSLTK